MTDPTARMFQEFANERRADPDGVSRLFTEMNTIDPFTGRRIPMQPQMAQQPGLGAKLMRLPGQIGRAMLESVDVVPEIHGGESIPLRKRLSRAMNIGTMFVPLAFPFKVAKTASLAAKAGLAAAGTATMGAASAAIGGDPIVPQGLMSGGIGGLVGAGASILAKRRIGKLSGEINQYFDGAPMTDPGTSPILNSKWGVLESANPDALAQDLDNMGYTYRTVRLKNKDSKTISADATLIHGIDDTTLYELSKKYGYNTYISSRLGYVDVPAGKIHPLDRTRTNLASQEPNLEVPVGGTTHAINLQYLDPTDINPAYIGHKSKFVDYGADELEQNMNPSVSSKIRLALTKAVRYTLGQEHVERLSNAGPDELASHYARQSADGLAEDSVYYGGVYSIKDRATPLFDKALIPLIKGRIKGLELEPFQDYIRATLRGYAGDKEATAYAGELLAKSPQFQPVFDDITNWAKSQYQWFVEAEAATADEVAALINTPGAVFSSLKDLRALIKTKGLAEAGGLGIDEVTGIQRALAESREPPLYQLIANVRELANLAKIARSKAAMAKNYLGMDPAVLANFAKRLPDSPVTPDKKVDFLAKMAADDIASVTVPASAGPDGVREARRISFQVTDPAQLEFIHGMQPAELNVYAKLLAPITTLYRLGTTLTAEFMARNPIKDMFFGKVTAGAPMRDWLAGVASAFTKDEKFLQGLRAGAIGAELVARDMLVAKDIIEKALGAPIGSSRRFLSVVKTPFDLLQSASLGLERGTRLGAFQRAFKEFSKTMGPEEAVREAALAGKNISVDFNMFGSRAAPVRLTTAFWNPQIQGYSRLVEQFHKDPKGTTARAVGYITVPSILFYLNNRNDPEYKQLPDWERSMFWHHKVGNQWLRIPKPYELGMFFGTAVEKMLDALDQQDPKILDEFAKDYTFRTGFDLVPIPTVARPHIENAINKSLLRGRPIVSKALEDVAPEFQTQPGTSNFAKNFGRMLGVSPVKVDNVLHGTFGGLGRQVIGAAGEVADLMEVAATDRKIESMAPSFDPRDLPLARAFVSQFPRNAEPIDRLYDFVDKAREASETADMLERGFRLDDLSEWMENRAQLVGVYDQIQPVLTMLGQLRRQRAMLVANETISPADKRRQFDAIDRQMMDMATTFYSSVKQYAPRD